MASQVGSRKRRKRSSELPDILPSGMNGTTAVEKTSSTPSPPTDMTVSANCGTNTCHHEQLLKALHKDVDTMRQLVTCKICDRLMYQPYAVSCGHTYCYSCLEQWLSSNRKKTCPDCRTKITQQPTPSFVIRELVLVLISRNELVPEGESATELNDLARTEGEIVAQAKANTDSKTGGLFKGIFRRRAVRFPAHFHDPIDGVDRCPRCHWELEEGFCNNCVRLVDDGTDRDLEGYDSDQFTTEDELDHEFDMEDMHAAFGDDEDHDGLGFGLYEDFHSSDNSDGFPTRPMRTGGAPRNERRGFATRIANSRNPRFSDSDTAGSGEDEEEEEENDEAEEELRDFVVDDGGSTDDRSDDNADNGGEDSGDDDSVNITEARDVSHRNARRAGQASRIVISDDDDDDAPASSVAVNPETGRDSGNESPLITRITRRNKRRAVPSRGRQRRIVDDDEDSDHELETHANDVAGFSSLDESAGDSESTIHSDRSDDSDDSDSDSDSEDLDRDHSSADEDEDGGIMGHEDDDDDGSDESTIGYTAEF